MNKQYWIVRPFTGRTGFAYNNKNKKLLANKHPYPIEDNDDMTSRSYLAEAPQKVYFDMTYLCNLNCRHCSTSSAPWRDTRKEMTASRIIEIIEELAANDVKEIEVGGGEPFMHPYWFFIFKHITDLGIRLIINSNGHMMNERNLQYLRTVKPSNVEISFEGAKELQNYIRGKDAYEKALKGMKNLIGNGTPTSARLTFCSTTLIDIEQLFADIAETGCQKLAIHTIKNIGRVELSPEIFAPMLDLEIARYLIELGHTHGLSVHFSNDDFPTHYQIEQVNRSPVQFKGGFDTCHISPFGQVTTSGLPDAVEFGVINKQSFMAVWQGQKANDFRKSLGELPAPSAHSRSKDIDYEFNFGYA
jgi:MoaA/NifB/PqqE/SkfB family radical SAM enzyme